jgi:uncharacterized protein
MIAPDSANSGTGDSPTASPAIQSIRPAERRAFQSSAFLFVFLRICIYLILAYGISYALQFAFKSFLRGESSPLAPRILMAGETIALAGAFLAAWIMAGLEKRSFGAYGLPLRGAFGKLFWQGVSLGLLEISAVVGAMAAFGAYHFGEVAIQGGDLLRWTFSWAAFFVVVGLYEEFQFRGYVQFAVAQTLGFWPAAVLLSVAFGLVHKGNPGESWAGIAGIVLTGLLWCFTLRRTGNLWLAVGMHASFDFGETFLYSVPDSGIVFPGHLSNATMAGPAWLTGGSVGPEASVFDFVMLVLFFFLIDRLYPVQPSKPTTQAPLG